MFLKWIILLVLLNNLCACESVKHDITNGSGSSWTTRMRAIQEDIKNCVKTSSHTSLDCLKITSLNLFDEMTSSKVIPLCQGIRLVQVVDSNDDRLTDPSDAAAQREVEGTVYLDQIAKRIAKVLQTHALQVRLKDIIGSGLDDKDTSSEVHGTPRHRRHKNNMMIAMVFGVTALGAVLVPLGFQVLSVVSGKALLLAKMALLLASINGLRKIASSGVHYGLYQVPPDPYGFHHGYYDRGDAAQQPRNNPQLVPNLINEV